jgi:hypothetical protein
MSLLKLAEEPGKALAEERIGIPHALAIARPEVVKSFETPAGIVY